MIFDELKAILSPIKVEELRTAMIKEFAKPGEALSFDGQCIADEEEIGKILFPVGSIAVLDDGKIGKIKRHEGWHAVVGAYLYNFKDLRLPDEVKTTKIVNISNAGLYTSDVAIVGTSKFEQALEAMRKNEPITIYKINKTWYYV
jgi:hypothetical protein